MSPGNIPLLGAGGDGEVDKSDSIFLHPQAQKLFQPVLVQVQQADVEKGLGKLTQALYCRSSQPHNLPEHSIQAASDKDMSKLDAILKHARILPLPPGTDIPPGVILDLTAPDFNLEKSRRLTLKSRVVQKATGTSLTTHTLPPGSTQLSSIRQIWPLIYSLSAIAPRLKKQPCSARTRTNPQSKICMHSSSIFTTGTSVSMHHLAIRPSTPGRTEFTRYVWEVAIHLQHYHWQCALSLHSWEDTAAGIISHSTCMTSNSPVSH